MVRERLDTEPSLTCVACDRRPNRNRQLSGACHGFANLSRLGLLGDLVLIEKALPFKDSLLSGFQRQAAASQ
jgi:hypothetical protein